METDFADWLRNQLEQRGWTQSELSRRSGVSPAQITRVLSGERGLGEKSISALAKALNLPVETVFRAAGLLPPPPSNEPPTLAEWIEIFMQADEKTREDLLNYAQYRADQERKAKRRGTNPVDQPVD